MRISMCLDINNSHLTKETFNSLNAEQEPYAYCYPEGLFLTIPDKTDISDYPSDLKKLIQYAWNHKISLIHLDRDAELFGYERLRIYDYEKEYRKQMSNFVWENCFYDPDKEREIYFGDIELSDQPKYRYYLFYDLGEHSFHTSIDRTTAEASQLPIQDIDTLQTEGHEIADLLSCQFVRKVLRLIETKDYQYQA